MPPRPITAPWKRCSPTASKGASAYSAKLVEFMKANTTSSLDFAQELFGVKTPAEALELWTSHTKQAARDA